ncbi:MAG: UPF0182 family protein [Xenococcaceae cyanobacterium MO_188.B32]|nr:UPF0182 family protein [Xenococcaceae cyanobacterium MO_188.B32]
MPKRFLELAFRLIVVVIGIWLVFTLIAHLRAEILWFQEVNYLATLIKRWQTQFFLWIFTCGVSSLFLLRNLYIANDLAWRWSPKQKPDLDRDYALLPKHEELALQQKKLTISYPQSVVETATSNVYTYRSCSVDSRFPALELPLLLPLILISCFLIALLFLNYSKIALSILTPDYSLPDVTPVLPSRWQFFSVQELLVSWVDDIWQLGVLGVIIFFLLIKPRICLSAIAIILSLVFSGVIAGNWSVFLKYIQSNTFGYVDPQFGKDIGFYVFNLPFWQLLDFWFSGLFTYGFISCLLLYLLSGNSLSEGKFPGFSSLQLRHLTFLGSTVMISIGVRHWLNRYDLLFSERGVTYGASFTDINVQLPWETVLNFTATGMAVFLIYRGITDYRRRKYKPEQLTKIPLLLVFFLIYILILPIANLSCLAVQRLIVQPNELAKEKPYIERSIVMTRKAFNLDAINQEDFNPQGQLTATDIANNDLTINNIRLWDTRPILQTNRQLQQIRLYYKFPDADIDRYLIENNNQLGDNKSKRQVIIAPRELDYSAVPERAKTWVNKHLIYTHGYGFTLSPVNRVDEGGLPYYFVKDIGTTTDEQATLSLSTDLDRDSIPIGKPRIYFGELTDNYIMTSTKVKELDYPSGDANVYNVYDGTGGIKIGNFVRRILFADYLADWQMLFTQNFTSDTKLIFRRNINRRIRTIAPFLRFDRDPYLVVANIKNPQQPQQDENYLYWMIDAYTTSDSYPYSDPGENNFNYIRNSVKVVVDAYNGKVDFYIADADDPIIQTWDKIFPGLLKPLEEMPEDLRKHIRYPEDLFSTQSERLLTYHMTDPQVFYNREDQWQIPDEIYGTESRTVKPYYLIMRLPNAEAEEFILLHPYTPTSRPNLIAWLAARSDEEEYGKLLLYTFPKQKLVYGPNQVEALINQDPVISQQISLWNREGSQAIQGNLLIIPIEQSLLYVEPLYLEAERNSLPILARVIVVYENQIVMAETLQEALNAIFTPGQNSSPAIIRSVDELTPLLEDPLGAEENVEDDI